MTWGESTGLSAPARVAKRSADIDAVRVLGIVAVVVGHIWTVGKFSDALYAWHVPVFFILTGYLWKPGRTLRDECIRRAKTLLIPYAFWLIIVGIAYCAFLFGQGRPFPAEEIRNAAYGGSFAVRPFSAFWFVTVLFFTAVLYRALEKLPAWIPWAVAAAGVLAVYIFGALMAKTPFSVALAFPCLALLLAGKELRRLVPRVTKPLLVGLILVVCGLTVVVIGMIAPVHMKYGDFGVPLLSLLNAVAISLGLILVAGKAIPMLSTGVQRTLTSLALVGFVVVLSHALSLSFLDTSPMGSWTDLVASLVIPWILALGIVRTRLRRWLVG